MALIGLGFTSTTISTSIKQPVAFEPIVYRMESFRRMADGTGRKDIGASVGRWRVEWRNLTYAEWQALERFWQMRQPVWLQDLEGGVWKVIVTGDLASPAGRFAGGARRYNAAMTLEWVGNNDPTTMPFTIGTSAIGGADVLATG